MHRSPPRPEITGLRTFARYHYARARYLVHIIRGNNVHNIMLHVCFTAHIIMHTRAAPSCSGRFSLMQVVALIMHCTCEAQHIDCNNIILYSRRRFIIIRTYVCPGRCMVTIIIRSRDSSKFRIIITSCIIICA